jgi:peptide/nickel transport system permease protein
MFAYIIRRTLFVVPVVFGVALVVFILFNVVGWNAAAQMLGRHAAPDEIVALQKQLGLTGPKWLNWQAAKQGPWHRLFDSQFCHYLKQIATLDFGRSFASNQKISTLIFNGMGPSLALAVPIFLVETVVSIAIALVAAFYRNTLTDRAIVVSSVIMMSVSYLVYIMVAQQVLAYQLGWFPIWGFDKPRIKFLILPTIVGVVSGLGSEVRFFRTVMLDEMYQDYVRTAFAKGCGQRTVLFKHVLKNAMIPIITSVVLAIPFLYSGNLLLETFFGVPGLGYLAVEAINSTDYPVIKATVLVGAVLYVIASLLTDICYALVDPRIKLR